MSFINKTLSLLRAVYSLLKYGEVTRRTYELRLAECHDCDRLIKTPHNLFCSACGCPPWYLSDLRTKARMPAVKCPLGKW